MVVDQVHVAGGVGLLVIAEYNSPLSGHKIMEENYWVFRLNGWWLV
jgi:hypothetical protein